MCLLFLTIVFFFEAKAQFINGYAKVTAISGLTFTLSNVNEVSDTFEDGEDIILMQMQANVLGNTTNTANFGDISAIGSAGRYEICRILSHTETSGVPATLTIQTATRATYSTDANSSLQIITFPNLGTPNFTTTSAMQARNWDGNVGGVVAFQVTETLTLAHNISADGAGFRGGARSANYYPGGTTCDGTYYIATADHTNNGAKGESIYRSTNINYDYARGKILNGGGGGNALINGGGAGGGNIKAGGDGGIGWNNTTTGCAPATGGLGGMSLEIYVSGSRAFMGGGGGGGQQNDTEGTAGGNGGGIVLIKARAIRTTGVCGITISANGTTVIGANNDGQGGGGAGGSIVFQTDSWNVVGTCPLTVTANGGTGGNVNSSIHGGGGGGAQGLVIYSIAIPTTNITTNTNVGIGGCNDTPCTTRAGNGTGANNAGIFGNIGTALPMQVISFSASLLQEVVALDWEVAEYVAIKRFEIEKTTNGKDWITVGSLEPSKTRLAYEYIDEAVSIGITYYRLKQIGTQDEIAYSNIASVHRKLAENDINLYPNPTTQSAYMDLPTQDKVTLRFVNVMGQVVVVPHTQKGNQITVDCQKIPKGMYQIQIKHPQFLVVKKFLVL